MIGCFLWCTYFRHKLELETEDKKSLDATISELRAKIHSQEEEMSRFVWTPRVVCCSWLWLLVGVL